ncbi:hypothetical protein BACFIN_06085 [Bacteroides finegoldii DSM 17565]|nr:hypothetical protein BACFIN_06085 [Bacteroides finegoldii DSM 17565]
MREKCLPRLYVSDKAYGLYVPKLRGIDTSKPYIIKKNIIIKKSPPIRRTRPEDFSYQPFNK